jgi:hypothetical protein
MTGLDRRHRGDRRRKTMKERPIIFSAKMILAILAGKKTQTRRVVKNICIYSIKKLFGGMVLWRSGPAGKFQRGFPGDDLRESCPYGQPGDRLWVRETWRPIKNNQTTLTYIEYKADGAKIFRDHAYQTGWDNVEPWRSSIHLPRRYSRIILEITNVRIERLQDINSESHDDVLKEGWPFEEEGKTEENPVWSFRRYWDSLNSKRGFGWETNPFVWVISFKWTEKGRKT